MIWLVFYLIFCCRSLNVAAHDAKAEPTSGTATGSTSVSVGRTTTNTFLLVNFLSLLPEFDELLSDCIRD